MTDPKIKIPLTTHVGRHTAATLLLEAGLSKESISIILGISIRIVDTYAKITGTKIKLDLQKMRNI
jgi:site-specific recombinase XerD